MEEFLRALYDDLPDGAWWYLWTLSADHKAKATYWMQGMSRTADVLSAVGPVHVYYPICWAAEQGKPNQRISADGIQPAGLIGLVCDLDFQSPDKPHAPPGETEALLLAERFPLVPTYCVHSGHGLQLGWLFKEPWAFDTPQERQQAADLSRSWAYTLMSIASKQSCEMDAVHDLPRVMRLPGTWNVKDPDRPIQTVLRWLDNDQRYNPHEFDEYLVEIPTLPKTPLPNVDMDACFPLEKHEALLQASADYAEVWTREERIGDGSCSAYDWELAKFTVWAGWSDDEIAALIRENQRQHGNKPGKDRDNKYIARTIAKCRDKYQEEVSEQRAVEVIEDEHADRDKRIAGLARRFDIPLTNIQFVLGDPAIVRLWVGGKPADVPATRMTTQPEFAAQITSVAKKVPKPVDKKDENGWRHYANTILALAETIDAGPDATTDGAFTDIVAAFIESRGAREVERGEVLTSTAPFTREGRVWFRLTDFAQYQRMHGDRLAQNALVQRLKLLGAEQKHHKVKRRNETTTVRFYGIPVERLRDE